MPLSFFKRRQPTPVVERSDPDRIAVLEHELLDIDPELGTPQALAVALARFVDPDLCPHANAIETSGLGQARPCGICDRCGVDLVATDDGNWERP